MVLGALGLAVLAGGHAWKCSTLAMIRPFSRYEFSPPSAHTEVPLLTKASAASEAGISAAVLVAQAIIHKTRQNS